MRRYNALHIPIMSFYSRALYRDVAHNWKGTGFFYLLLILAVCLLLSMTSLYYNPGRGAGNDGSQIVSGQKPQHGLSSKATQGQRHAGSRQERQERVSSVVIKLPPKDAAPEKIAIHMWVTFMKLILSARDNPDGEPDLRILLTMFDFDEAPQKKNVPRGTIDNYVLFVAYLLSLAVAYIFRVLQVLVYAAIGRLFASGHGVRLHFGALMRLAVVAITPMIIVTTLLDIADIQLPLAWVWAFLGAMGYLYFGVQAACSTDKSQSVRS